MSRTTVHAHRWLLEPGCATWSRGPRRVRLFEVGPDEAAEDGSSRCLRAERQRENIGQRGLGTYGWTRVDWEEVAELWTTRRHRRRSSPPAATAGGICVGWGEAQAVERPSSRRGLLTWLAFASLEIRLNCRRREVMPSMRVEIDMIDLPAMCASLVTSEHGGRI